MLHAGEEARKEQPGATLLLAQTIPGRCTQKKIHGEASLHNPILHTHMYMYMYVYIHVCNNLHLHFVCVPTDIYIYMYIYNTHGLSGVVCDGIQKLDTKITYGSCLENSLTWNCSVKFPN